MITFLVNNIQNSEKDFINKSIREFSVDERKLKFTINTLDNFFDDELAVSLMVNEQGSIINIIMIKDINLTIVLTLLKKEINIKKKSFYF